MTDSGRSAGANSRLAKKRVQFKIEALCFVSSSVLADSLVLRNPLLRQVPNRWYFNKSPILPLSMGCALPAFLLAFA